MEAPAEIGAQDVASPATVSDEPQEVQRSLIAVLFTTFHHFFGQVSDAFGSVRDSRDSHRIRYPSASLLFAGVLLFLFRLRARREVALKLRNGPSAAKFLELFGVDSFPHGDTLNAYFSTLRPSEVQEIPSGMVETLIRKEVLMSSRLQDTYYVIAIDGTGTVTYSHRHCPHCLTQSREDTTIYYHCVLEAKLVTPNGFCFSLMSEFIENPSKQDCELRSFYRLAKKLHRRFPRLPIALSLDALYAARPVFDLCRHYGWAFMITLKDKDLPTVHREFCVLTKLQPENKLRRHTGNKADVLQEFRWVNDIDLSDSQKKTRTLSVLQCVESTPTKTGDLSVHTFKWVTNLRVTADNVTELASNGGRIRWKVENEGFNTQKNGGFELGHAFSNNPTSAKVFHLLLQAAHIVDQLIEKGSLLNQLLPGGIGSGRHLAFRLLEAWRNAVLTTAFFRAVTSARLQIRFDTS